MSDWRITTIGAIARVFDGPHATPKRTPAGPWFLNIGSLRGGRLDLSESAHISEADFVTWTRRITPMPGDVLFSYETRLGEAALMPPGLRACLGRRMGLLRPQAGRVDSRFLLYAYLAPALQEVIRQRTVHGATVDRIPLVELPSWPIVLPSLEEQQAIAALLGVLDDKIALNDRFACTSFDLAHALFSVSAQCDTRKTFLRDIIELRYGKALTERNREPGAVPVFGGNGRSGWHSQQLSRGPGIIVGRKGANAGSVSWSQGPFWVIDTAFYVDSISESIPLEYLYFLLQEVGFRSQVGDSAIPGLNREIALACTAMLPPENVICSVASKVRPLLELRAHLSQESASLADLRDTLLPRLMSGEIRVRQAERIVEDAT